MDVSIASIGIRATQKFSSMRLKSVMRSFDTNRRDGNRAMGTIEP